jgi:2-dehydropantoate 2-reductase
VIPLGKIAIVGTGAIGGYYGGLLAHHGHDVHFLLRSEYEAVRKNGLRIIDKEKPFHLPQVNAYNKPENIGPCDLVIVSLKSTMNDQLLTLLPPLLREDTLILTLQNGLGADEFLGKHFGPRRVLGGLCFVCLTRTAPGVVDHFAGGRIDLGEFAGKPQPRTQAIVDAFNKSGIESTLAQNLGDARWKKLCWNIPFNGLSIAAGGVDCAVIMASPVLKKLARDLMNEIQAAARRLGHEIPDNYLDHQFVRTSKMGQYRPSSLVDFQEGRAVEVEPIWGEPCRRGQQAGEPMPRLEMLYELLASLDSENQKSK